MLLSEYNWLADENIHPQLILHFQKKINITTVSEAGLQGNPDTDILEYAYQNNQVVLTQDSDFGKLIFVNKMKFSGVVYLRPGHLHSTVHIKTLEYLLHGNIETKSPFLLVAENISGHITVRLRNNIIVL
jgi:predicted nuclease of predicted toxin-antitoxin system